MEFMEFPETRYRDAKPVQSQGWGPKAANKKSSTRLFLMILGPTLETLVPRVVLVCFLLDPGPGPGMHRFVAVLVCFLLFVDLQSVILRSNYCRHSLRNPLVIH